ncbi:MULTISPECIES: tripartite tricarboxylate transporter TctB family protein [unclassified Halomonas]|uniref:tripartite tricarboxylate transporter TctB family protein n=1 Tax=unclassified Halomonas TaxID=2609666 RepID=UPI0020977065|nr:MULTISPECIES: tripartite tricarboxylate transporter TctB family protein [unclassified Halomonas]MCO7217713.1 tripartite tricarboxylate transporter TctB family protein [Halomonas sp. OfavH-34-E]
MHTKFTVFAVLLLVLAAVTLVPTLDFPSSEDVSTFIGPRLWPLSLLLLLIVLSATLLVSTRMSQAKERASDAEAKASMEKAPATDPGQQADAGQASATDSATDNVTDSTTEAADVALNPGFLAANRHWWLMGTTVAYTLLMPAIGFLLATVIFTLACTLLLGARHWAALLATVVIAVALIQGVFSTLLGIPLP